MANSSIKSFYKWLSSGENLFFIVLIFLHLVPIIFFKYFPSQDGPQHLDNAKIIREYVRPEATILREYYQFNKRLDANWPSHLFLAGLMFFVPILIAEKVILAGYVVLLAVSVRYALKAVRPESSFIAVLIFPFIYSFPFHMGFYNFCYGIILFFIVIGYWIKQQEKVTPWKIGTLTLLAIILFFCHIVPFLGALILVVVYGAWQTAFEFVSGRKRQQPGRIVARKMFLSRLFVTLCAFLPSMIFALHFLYTEEAGDQVRLSTTTLFSRLALLDSLISYRESEVWLSGATAVLFAIILGYLLVCKLLRRGVERGDGLLLAAVFFIFIYFIIPDETTGGYYISNRLNLFPAFGLILWFGAQSYHRIVKRGIQLVSAAITLGMLGFHMISYAELNDYLVEYFSGMNLVRPNSTLLPLCFSPQGVTPHGHLLSARVEPFLHASGYVAAEKASVDLDNYEAATDYFPMIFRSELNPFIHIAKDDIESTPPCVEFRTYPQRTNGSVDYVVVWQVPDGDLEHECAKSIFRQLEAGYELIYRSPQHGFMRLYRRKDWIGSSSHLPSQLPVKIEPYFQG